eukprot:TRINITY_DN24643_c0_g1_i1.p1 TRINITY_DN24643_c0_g1~~TRINITY_DN24643_c0_g1_i1.p1  ORF type:complete len:601 (+),score=79.62 TRINITY_DN24643_c0_g1_i1:63-1865(+)
MYSFAVLAVLAVIVPTGISHRIKSARKQSEVDHRCSNSLKDTLLLNGGQSVLSVAVNDEVLCGSDCEASFSAGLFDALLLLRFLNFTSRKIEAKTLMCVGAVGSTQQAEKITAFGAKLDGHDVLIKFVASSEFNAEPKRGEVMELMSKQFPAKERIGELFPTLSYFGGLDVLTSVEASGVSCSVVTCAPENKSFQLFYEVYSGKSASQINHLLGPQRQAFKDQVLDAVVSLADNGMSMIDLNEENVMWSSKENQVNIFDLTAQLANMVEQQTEQTEQPKKGIDTNTVLSVGDILAKVCKVPDVDTFLDANSNGVDYTEVVEPSLFRLWGDTIDCREATFSCDKAVEYGFFDRLFGVGFSEISSAQIDGKNFNNFSCLIADDTGLIFNAGGPDQHAFVKFSTSHEDDSLFKNSQLLSSLGNASQYFMKGIWSGSVKVTVKARSSPDHKEVEVFCEMFEFVDSQPITEVLIPMSFLPVDQIKTQVEQMQTQILAAFTSLISNGWVLSTGLGDEDFSGKYLYWNLNRTELTIADYTSLVKLQDIPEEKKKYMKMNFGCENPDVYGISRAFAALGLCEVPEIPENCHELSEFQNWAKQIRCHVG